MQNPHSPDTPAPAIGVTLGLLGAAYALSYVDRTILSLLVGPVRSDLQLSDTEFSLLGGLAFAVFYSTLGIPFGWWADRGDRLRIIALGIGAWSAATFACGFARTFGALFAGRIGVGVGEAALSPAAYSLIADTVPHARLGRALTLYSSAIYLGIGMTFVGGGLLVESLDGAGAQATFLGLSGWQLVFLIVGAPGLVLAPLVMLALREPRRRERAEVGSDGAAPLSALRGRRGFLALHFVGFALLTLVFNGYLAWEIELLLRNYGVGKAAGGLAVGLAILVFGTGGMLAGGRIADRLRARGDPRGAMTAAFRSAVALVPFAALSPMVPGAALAIALFAPIVFLSAFAFGCAVTALQLALPPRLRARVSAIYLLVVNLAGIGLGGTAVALLSDGVTGDLGTALSIVGGAAGVVAALVLHRACALAPADGTSGDA